MKDREQIDPLSNVSHAIAQHPNFTSAVLVYVQEMAKWRGSLGRVAAAATSYGGTQAVGFVLVLHFANTTGNPDNGATYTRLHEICQLRNLCGSRALRTLLTLARLAGYLQVEQGCDRRVQILVPTRKLIAKSQDLYRCPMSSLDQLVERPIYAEAIRSDPG